MSATTTTLAIPYPVSADKASDFPTIAMQAADKIDAALAPLETTAWETLPLGTGWTAIAGHEPRIRLLGGIVCIEGAVTRGSGGDLAAIATLPARYRSASGTQFVGASVAVRAASTWAPLALYVAGGTGVLGCKGYTTIDGNVGWTVPVSCTFARK